MPRVTRRRTLEAPVPEVWKLVSDPYALPRWWPRVSRVEDVDTRSGGRRSQWTKVLETNHGRGVRADYRCLSSAVNERYVWEQQLEDSPFAKHLKFSRVEIEMHVVGERDTRVVMTSQQTMRGMSRLGGWLMRKGQRDILDGALDGLERALA
ncbi:MAG TPA: SRPBCC family protein [Solirubrobacterales bacterium]|nr:SRPBCC family protein [Solirubrobacterales bacterium]